MTAEIDAKTKIAAQSAKVFLTQMNVAGVPSDVQLMAVQMLAQTIFITSVKKEKRLQFLTRWMQSLRTTIIEAGKEADNAEKRNH